MKMYMGWLRLGGFLAKGGKCFGLLRHRKPGFCLVWWPVWPLSACGVLTGRRSRAIPVRAEAETGQPDSASCPRHLALPNFALPPTSQHRVYFRESPRNTDTNKLNPTTQIDIGHGKHICRQGKRQCLEHTKESWRSRKSNPLNLTPTGMYQCSRLLGSRKSPVAKIPITATPPTNFS